MNTKIFISMAEANSFVTTATELCHDKDGVYNPMLKDFAIKYAILAHFTDYRVSDNDIEVIYSDVYTTDIAENIKNLLCVSEQLSSLITAVDENLEIEKLRMSRNNKLTKLFDELITTIEQQPENPETTEAAKQALAEVGKTAVANL